MPIEITSFLHAGIRVGPSEDEQAAAKAFYAGLLGLETDDKRPDIKGIPGFWSNVHAGDRGQQIHIMGAEGMSPSARSTQEDPTRHHLAFAVADLDEAKKELEASGFKYWIYESLVGDGSYQLFCEDPFGNMIELQQASA